LDAFGLPAFMPLPQPTLAELNQVVRRMPRPFWRFCADGGFGRISRMIMKIPWLSALLVWRA